MPYNEKEIEIKQNALQFAKDRGDKIQERQANIELGKAYLDARQEQNAIKCYQNAKKIAQERGDKYQEGEAYLVIGHAYHGAGQYETAIENYQKVQEIAQERGDKRQEGEAYLAIGNANYDVGHYQTAIEYFQKALGTSQSQRDKQRKTNTFLMLGKAFSHIRQHKEAVKCHEKALELSKDLGNESQELIACIWLGYSHYHAGQNEPAISCYKEALKIAEDTGKKTQEWHVYQGLGAAYDNVGQSQDAISCFQEALKITENQKNKSLERITSTSLGHSYYKITKFQKAIECYERAQNIPEQLGAEKEDVNAYVMMGKTYQCLTRHQKAIECYQKGEKIAREREDKEHEGKAFQGLGHAYFQTSRYQEAINCSKKVLQLAQDQGDKRQEGRAYQGLGVCYFHLGQREVASSNFKKAIEIAKEVGDKSHEGNMSEWLGDSLRNMTKYREAIVLYEATEKIARELGDKKQESRVSLELENAHYYVGQYDLAKACYQKARKLAGDPGIEGQRKVLWTKTSIKHRDKFEKLVNILETEPEKAIKIGTYSVCLNSDFDIGHGSDGTTVYIGLCDDGMEVAVKSLLRDRCEHLGSNEKEILNYVKVRKEQHIVNYRFYNVDSRNAYLVLDLCEETLEKYVDSAESSKAMLESKGVTFLRQILLGLKALHCGDPEILHRDLKPSNIFVNVEGELVLADFGISRKLIEGQTTYKSGQKGTLGWIAVESLSTDGQASIKENKVRYKKQSDIQVAGMIFFYILTKGNHPYGIDMLRTYNLSEGNPVDLKNVSDPLAKDLIQWMLQHDLKERPGVEECLKHPYLMSTDEMFHFVTRVGNELEIKTKDVNSAVVTQLNADLSLPKPSWKPKIDTEVMSYVSGHRVYSDDVADLLRFIRNTDEHWGDKTPPTTVQAKVGTPKEYFLSLFPTLPVVVHRIIRKDPDWKQREKLKQFF